MNGDTEKVIVVAGKEGEVLHIVEGKHTLEQVKEFLCKKCVRSCGKRCVTWRCSYMDICSCGWLCANCLNTCVNLLHL